VNAFANRDETVGLNGVGSLDLLLQKQIGDQSLQLMEVNYLGEHGVKSMTMLAAALLAKMKPAHSNDNWVDG